MSMGAFFEPPPGPEDPLGFLNACHRRLEARLGTLERVAVVLELTPGERLDAAAAAIQAAVQHVEGAARLHLADEDESFFPRLMRAAPELADVLASLHGDHVAIDAAWVDLAPVLKTLLTELDEGRTPAVETVSRMRSLARAFQALHEHHHGREEREIWPRARAALGATELAAIGQEMRDRRGLAG